MRHLYYNTKTLNNTIMSNNNIVAILILTFVFIVSVTLLDYSKDQIKNDILHKSDYTLTIKRVMSDGDQSGVYQFYGVFDYTINDKSYVDCKIKISLNEYIKHMNGAPYTYNKQLNKIELYNTTRDGDLFTIISFGLSILCAIVYFALYLSINNVIQFMLTRKLNKPVVSKHAFIISLINLGIIAYACYMAVSVGMYLFKE